jgi:hypothetical protein
VIAHGQDSESSGRGVLTTIAFDVDHPRKGTTLGTGPAPTCRPRRGGAFCFPQVRATSRSGEMGTRSILGQFGGLHPTLDPGLPRGRTLREAFFPFAPRAGGLEPLNANLTPSAPWNSEIRV